MTTTNRSLINPDPVDDAGKHAHRAGAPNHHHNTGSGENPMVGATSADDGIWLSDSTSVDAVRVWLSDESYRFLPVDDAGRFTVWLDRLAVLVAEILDQRTETLRAELDAANDAVAELIDQHDAAVRALDSWSGVA